MTCPHCRCDQSRLYVGDILGDEGGSYYCGGAFGRDGYGPWAVEAVGRNWVVVRHAEQPERVDFCSDMARLIEYRRKP